MEYKFLTIEKFEPIYDVFIKSFSNYLVKMNPTKEQFQEMLTRRGVDLDISIGAYYENNLIGFNLNGIGFFNNEITIYDCGTGVTPEFRGKNLTVSLFENSFEKLRAKKASKYVLEVIENNIAALKVYQKIGFREHRYLQCFKYSKSCNTLIPKDLTSEIKLITTENNVDLGAFKSFWDYYPSWQNSIESINRSTEKKVTIIAYKNNYPIGYGIIYINSGDIPQLAVAKEHRNQTIAKHILNSLISHCDSQIIKIINVDSSCDAMISLLRSFGFEHFINQYEMLLNL